MVHCLLALLILHRIFPLDGSLLIDAGLMVCLILSESVFINGVSTRRIDTTLSESGFN